MLNFFLKAWRNWQYSNDFRAKFVREVYTGMERELSLVGVTGIEDRLQEEVVETIKDLRTARIKVWMLTGDKKETAINLGYSAGLLTQDRTLIGNLKHDIPSIWILQDLLMIWTSVLQLTSLRNQDSIMLPIL